MKALIVVDLQNDFCSNGVLEVKDAESIIPIANQLMASGYFDVVVATQDWHPADHKCFAANHHFRYPGQVVEINGIPQQLWAMHCVQGAYGAKLTDELNLDTIDKIIQKGSNKEIDTFSGFRDNKKENPTELEDYLKKAAVQQVFILGLATEYSVKHTALDAVDLGFKTFLIEDACRAVNLEESDGANAIQEMQEADITLLDSDQLVL